MEKVGPISGPFPAALKVQEATNSAARLEAAAQSIFETQESSAGQLAVLLPDKVAVAISGMSKGDMYHTLRRWAEDLMARPLLTMTLAIEVNSRFDRQIIQWIASNIADECLVSLVCDPAIVGGLVVEWKGQRDDYSIKGKLSKYMEEHKMFSVDTKP